MIIGKRTLIIASLYNKYKRFNELMYLNWNGYLSYEWGVELLTLKTQLRKLGKYPHQLVYLENMISLDELKGFNHSN